MSVASKNPFELLGGEGDSQSAAPSATVEKEQTTAAPATSSARGGQKGRTGPASRGGRYYARGGANKTGPRDQGETEEGAAREGKRNGEEAGRGRGRGGRGRGDRGRAGGRGRPFDKHSATGKIDSDKKIHQGWGGDEGNSELKAEVDGSKDADAEVPTNDWANGGAAGADDAWGVPAPAGNGETPAADAPAEGRRPPREEEEDNTLTLDQYLAKQKENDTVPKLETIRKANDGADDLFKDAIKVVKSNEEDAYFAGKPKQSKQRTKTKDEKVVIEIDGQFSDRVARGGRGGRGGDRARGPRGGARGGRGRGRGEFQGSNGNTGAVDVADQSAFPSLA